METRFDPRYCPQCYQYVDGTGISAQACRACFGNHGDKPETSFEAAFVLMADVDGGTGAEVAGTAGQPQDETVGILYAGEPESLHTE
jgi:hypothetical protein